MKVRDLSALFPRPLSPSDPSLLPHLRVPQHASPSRHLHKKTLTAFLPFDTQAQKVFPQAQVRRQREETGDERFILGRHPAR
jgi:hypothetical protein